MKRLLAAFALVLCLMVVPVKADGGGPENPPAPCPPGTACATAEAEPETAEAALVAEVVAGVIASFIGNLF